MLRHQPKALIHDRTIEIDRISGQSALINVDLSDSLRSKDTKLGQNPSESTQNRDRSGLWQKSTLKKHLSKEKKRHIFSQKQHPFHKQKALLEQKKVLSKHYFINKKQ